MLLLKSVLSTRVCCFFAMLVFVASPSLAQNEVEKQTQNLKKLRSQIALIQANIEEDIGIKHQYIVELRGLDKKISKFSRKIRTLNVKQKKINNESRKLRKKLKKLISDLKVQQQTLAKQIKSTYKIGQQQTLQIVLNQKSVDSVSRVLTYANYLSTARSKHIKRTKNLSKSVTESVNSLVVQQRELKENQLLLESNKISLTTSYASRKRLLKEISKKLMKKEKKLSSMEDDSARLQGLIKSLGELLFDIPPPPQELLPFVKLKGKLVWPTKGKVIHYYRQKKHNLRMRWKGIVIKTKRGKDVKAVYSGRIVFSDWLNGFGNIIIVDHGSSYLSLYAYNQSLEREIGEWVAKGDVIATVGQSGGQKNNALYFEIRKNGKPVNPLKWIKRG